MIITNTIGRHRSKNTGTWDSLISIVHDQPFASTLFCRTQCRCPLLHKIYLNVVNFLRFRPRLDFLTSSSGRNPESRSAATRAPMGASNLNTMLWLATMASQSFLLSPISSQWQLRLQSSPLLRMYPVRQKWTSTTLVARKYHSAT